MHARIFGVARGTVTWWMRLSLLRPDNMSPEDQTSPWPCVKPTAARLILYPLIPSRLASFLCLQLGHSTPGRNLSGEQH